MQLGFFEYLKQFGSIIEKGIQKLTQNLITSSHIDISHNNFSYLFDRLFIMVSRLLVKSVSLRFGGFLISATRILFLHIVISVVESQCGKIFNFYGPDGQSPICFKKMSTFSLISSDMESNLSRSQFIFGCPKITFLGSLTVAS